jgi:hypothetical protein
VEADVFHLTEQHGSFKVLKVRVYPEWVNITEETVNRILKTVLENSSSDDLTGSKDHLDHSEFHEDHMKLFLTYKYKGETYEICLTTLWPEKISRHPDHPDNSEESVIHKRIIGAYLKNDSGTIKDVTKVVLRFQGPHYNFYHNIIGASNKIMDIFHEHNIEDWNTLCLDDTYGDETVIEINKDCLGHLTIMKSHKNTH